MSIAPAPNDALREERSSMEGRLLGRYEVLTLLAAGGMAEVYVGRAVGVAGFERLVAIKVLHAHLAHEQEFISMFLDEARLAARIRHPNVVPTLDISDTGGDGYFLVMDYVEGCHFGTLIGQEAQHQRTLPVDVVVRIAMDALAGLGAAHKLTDDEGQPLNIVHRDVSPHNLIVGADGICRLTDFGVAKAEIRLAATRAGQFKGKLGYMAPEQAATGNADQRADLFSMGVILWEALTGSRLFRGKNNMDTLNKMLSGPIPPPSFRAPHLQPFDALLARALDRNEAARFQSADEFIEALEGVARSLGGAASSRVVAQHVTRIAGPTLDAQRAALKDAIDSFGRASLVGDFVPASRQSDPGRLSAVPQLVAAPGPGLDARASDPGQALAFGTVVDGRYRIDSTLGKGGHGVVYGATHTGLGKRVALKALREDLTVTPEVAARFEQEARSVAAMGHANIVDITDFGHLPDGRSYFVMEYLDGCTLRERIQGGPLPTDEALRVLTQCASALAAAHGQRVIHRDLKPENIFLVGRGTGPRTAKVLDFGVAKVASAKRITEDDMVFGTPQYMSPEQASGEPVDARTDVYALGVIFYEMLTGAVPFNGDTFMNILYQHRSVPPPGHVRLTRDEPQLGGIVLRALAKDPNERYPNMDALLADLPAVERSSRSSLVGAKPALAAATSTSRGTGGKRRALVWAASATVGLTLAGALAFITLGPRWSPSNGSFAGARDSAAHAPERRASDATTAPVAVPVAPSPAPALAAEAETAPAPAPEPTPARATGREVLIVSTPAGAMVSLDDALIGNTPLAYYVEDGSDEARLTLRLEGRHSALVAVSPDSPSRIEVALSPSESSSSSGLSRPTESPSPRAPPPEAAGTPTAPTTTSMATALPPAVVDPWQ